MKRLSLRIEVNYGTILRLLLRKVLLGEEIEAAEVEPTRRRRRRGVLIRDHRRRCRCRPGERVEECGGGRRTGDAV